MLSVRWQTAPLESGSHLLGARFNRIGERTLYLSASHSVAIAEYHQLAARPGTLVGYDIVSPRIADLTDTVTLDEARIDRDVLACPWATMLSKGQSPPTWPVVARLVADGAHGILVPSYQSPAGVNLVLWQWHDAGIEGEGAAVRLVDPDGDLRRP